MDCMMEKYIQVPSLSPPSQNTYQEQGKSFINSMSWHAVLWDTLPLKGLHVLHYYCV